LLAKLSGVALILGSTSYAGWQVAGAYARRPRQLRDLQTALAVLQTEIDYGATPLPDALRAAALAAVVSVGCIFTCTGERMGAGGGITPGEALRGALQEMAPETALSKQDSEVLSALASVLGASSRADQVRHLTLARERLSGQEAQAQEARLKYERVARTMGVLIGLGLVFILL
jgi:stage III sporulation protein AB